MIPIHLRISGFLSYQEPIDLDFTSFSIACISGQNGAGKSSLLDAMTWALFGKARRTDDAIINSSKNIKAAEVVFDFQYESNLYRVQRSKPREKAAVLEFFIWDDAGVWRPLSEKSARDTENRIQTILRMDYETFTNASFFLQGRADQFAQQRPGDRKRVLSSILGLEIWNEYRDATAERRKNEEARLKVLDSQLEEIENELAQEETRKSKLAEAEAQLDSINKTRKSSELVLSSLQRQGAVLSEQLRMVEVLKKNAYEARQTYEKQRSSLDELIRERSVFQEVLKNEALVRASYQHWQDLRAALSRWDEVAANFREVEARRSAPLTVIASEASGLDLERRNLLQKEFNIQKDNERLPGLRKQLDDVEQQISQLEASRTGRTDLETVVMETQNRFAETRAENTTLKESMRVLKERIDRLSQAAGAVCPLCGQPLSPDERKALISNLENEGKEMGNRYRANLEWLAQAEDQLRQFQARLAGFTRLEDELHAHHRLFDRLEIEYNHLVKQVDDWSSGEAVRLAEVIRILAADDFAHEARRVLAEIDAESKALGYDSAAHDAVRREEIEARSSENGLRELESAMASLAPLERQIRDLEQQITEALPRLLQQEKTFEEARERYEAEASQLPDINQIEGEVFALQSEENRIRMEVGMIRQSVAVLNTQRERRTRFMGQREAITQKIVQLKILERAFSKDGVPALLIEQALPEIESEANEILDRLSNGNMSVRFETQRQYKDKSRDDRRETLDIIISDSSGEREYELFSGGEAFRVNFAIRLSLSRVLAQRAGARLQTLVIDEGFGSQDTEGRQRLIEAINMVRPEFAKILIITHLEEMKEVFPARIEVSKSIHGSQLMVIT